LAGEIASRRLAIALGDRRGSVGGLRIERAEDRGLFDHGRPESYLAHHRLHQMAGLRREIDHPPEIGMGQPAGRRVRCSNGAPRGRRVIR